MVNPLAGRSRAEKAGSFLITVVVVAVCALLLRIAVKQLIKYNIEKNQSSAQETLKLISTALENYARNNKAFPVDISVLTKGSPSYLDKDYLLESPFKGYAYVCSRLDATSYSCSAMPTKCKVTGRRVYTVSTGGVLVSEDCDKKMQ